MARFNPSKNNVSMERLVTVNDGFSGYEDEDVSEVGYSEEYMEGIAGLEHIYSKFQAISTEQLGLDHVRIGLEKRIEAINGSLAGTGISIDTANVSQEGIFSGIVKTVKWFFEQFKKVWAWLLDKLKFLFNYNVACTKATSHAAKEVIKIVDGKPITAPNITVNLPYVAYTIFHTPSFAPKPGVGFNDNNVLKSLEDVKAGINRMGAAVEESVNSFTKIAEEIFDSIERNRQVSSADTFRHQKRGQIGQLIDSQFEMLGFRVEQGEVKESNPYIKETPTITPMVESSGWKTRDKNFAVSLASGQLGNVVMGLESQVKLVAAESESIINELKRKNILKRLADYRLPTPTDMTEIENNPIAGSVSKNTRDNIYWNAKAVGYCYDAVMTMQRLVEKYDFFLQQYITNTTAFTVAINKKTQEAVNKIASAV